MKKCCGGTERVSSVVLAALSHHSHYCASTNHLAARLGSARGVFAAWRAARLLRSQPALSAAWSGDFPRSLVRENAERTLACCSESESSPFPATCSERGPLYPRAPRALTLCACALLESLECAPIRKHLQKNNGVPQQSPCYHSCDCSLPVRLWVPLQSRGRTMPGHLPRHGAGVPETLHQDFPQGPLV